MSKSIEELKAAWNAKADRLNQWDELGLDEIVHFAQEQAIASLTPAGEMGDEEVLHIWDTRVGQVSGKFPLCEGDVLNFARAIESRTRVPVSGELPPLPGGGDWAESMIENARPTFEAEARQMYGWKEDAMPTRSGGGYANAVVEAAWRNWKRRNLQNTDFLKGYKIAIESRSMMPKEADATLCPHCKGSGESTVLSGGGPDAYDVPCDCPTCGGTGEVGGFENSAAPGWVTDECPACKGSGQAEEAHDILLGENKLLHLKLAMGTILVKEAEKLLMQWAGNASCDQSLPPAGVVKFLEDAEAWRNRKIASLQSPTQEQGEKGKQDA